MLLGYDENGDIKFIFTDDDYLRSKFPNNTAKISNFWKVKDHGLKELFTDDFTGIDNVPQYKVVDDKIVKKKDCEIKEKNSKSCDIINAKVEVKNVMQEIENEKKEESIEIRSSRVLSDIAGIKIKNEKI